MYVHSNLLLFLVCAVMHTTQWKKYGGVLIWQIDKFAILMSQPKI